VGIVGDLALVVTRKGRRVIDLLTCKWLAKHETGFDALDETAMGIGPLAGRSVDMIELADARENGYHLAAGGGDADVLVLVDPDGGPRVPGRLEDCCASGFSETDRALIVADANVLHVWGE
jgi:hypothetical protein